MTPDCLFCRIIAKEIPTDILYEDDATLAFLDIRPINPGHMLVVPKEHHANIYDIPADVFARVMETARMLTPKVKAAVGAEGVNIGINNDRVAGQVIFHLHVHIMPRFANDGHRHWHGEGYKEGEALAVADKIRATLN